MTISKYLESIGFLEPKNEHMNSTSGLLADMSPRAWQDGRNGVVAGSHLAQVMIAQQTVSRLFRIFPGLGYWILRHGSKTISHWFRKNVQFSKKKIKLSFNQIHTEHYPATTRAKSHDIVFHLQPLCKPENIYRVLICA